LAQDIQIEELGLYAHRGTVKEMSGFHAHFDVEVNYVYQGYMKYFMGQSEFTVPAGKVCAFWGSTPHRLMSVAPNTEAAILTIPVTWLVRWALPKRLKQAFFEGGILIEHESTTHPERVDLWCRDFKSKESTLRVATQLELQATLLRMMPHDLKRNWGTGAPEDLTPVLVMCRYITTHLNAPLASTEISAQAGIHVNYAARVFKKATGMNIQEYVMRQRVATAQRILLTTDESVETTGVIAGFQSNSQFFSAFKKITESTPLQYRKQNSRPSDV
jgi:AraC family transcriptional regulator, melibiose operon regulatory protein